MLMILEKKEELTFDIPKANSPVHKRVWVFHGKVTGFGGEINGCNN